jgi:integrase
VHCPHGGTYIPDVAWIEDRISGPRVAWRLNHPGHQLHGKRQHLECDDDDNAEKVLALVEAHKGSLTRDEVEELVLGPTVTTESTAPDFGAWSADCLENKTRISPRTLQDYRDILAYRILPSPEEIEPPARVVAGWRGRPMDGFLPRDITKYLNGLRDEGLASTTITKHFALISSIFAAAVKNKIISENPCDDTDFVRNQVEHDDTGEEHHVYLTPEEWQILYRHIPETYQDFVETLVATADRYSEAAALQARDLIPPTARDPFPRIQTRRAWKKNEEGEYYLGTTKGRQRRNNRVDDDLWIRLLRRCENKAPDALIFTAPKGGRIEYQNFRNRVWNPSVTAAMRCPVHPPPPQASPLAVPVGVCGDHGGISGKTGQPCQKQLAAGLDRCTWHAGPAPDAVSDCDCPDVLHRRPSPHDLRHTCAAWMLADPTVAPLYVSRYLGHASMEVTDKVYAGLVPHGEGAAVLAIARARGRATAASVESPVVTRRQKRLAPTRAGAAARLRRGRRSAA